MLLFIWIKTIKKEVSLAGEANATQNVLENPVF